MPKTIPETTPEKRDVYINVYKGKHGLFSLGENETREAADDDADVLAHASGGNRVGCMRVELEADRWDD